MDTPWLALCRVHCRVTDLRSLLGIIKMHPGLRAILPAWLHHLLVSVCICFYFPEPFISLRQNIMFVFLRGELQMLGVAAFPKFCADPPNLITRGPAQTWVFAFQMR